MVKIKPLEELTLLDAVLVLSQVSVVRYRGKLLESQGTTGYYDPDNRTIYIDQESPRDVQQATIIHEILHAFNHLYNLPDKEQQVVKAENKTWEKL